MSSKNAWAYQDLRTTAAVAAVENAIGCLCGQDHEPYLHVKEAA